MRTNKKLLLSGFFFVTLLVTALTISTLKKPQQIRSHASAGSTTLTLIPASSSKQVSDTIDLDLMVNPGNNLVSFVKFQLAFDSTKLALVTTEPFTLNTQAFPSKVEGPIINSESIGESVSVGADGTKVIQAPTKVGTVHFKALSPTGNTPATVTFTNITQALSIGSQDTPVQNVLASTTPATITIGGTNPVTPQITDPCINAQGNCPPSLTPTSILTPSVTGGSGSTASFTLLLHGIGSSGDNPNPNGSSLSNKKPLHPQRHLEAELYDIHNQLVSKTSGQINYDASTGAFKGNIDLGPNFKTGSYTIKVKTDRYLRRLVPGAQNIKSSENNSIPQTALVAGDTNGDNILDILDYNALLHWRLLSEVA